MIFFQFPCEIRDLIYSFIILRDKTYTVLCGNETPHWCHPQIIFIAKPNLGILWTSKAIQHEFLKQHCAINSFRITLPTDYTSTQLSKANLLRLIEDDDIERYLVLRTLAKFTNETFKHDMCRICIGKAPALGISFFPSRWYFEESADRVWDRCYVAEPQVGQNREVETLLALGGSSGS